ncbi:hypothetical protein GF374_02315 [Candidatus Woesearchaeota archaeon]|nr:hypothetical protein [Candidatus Woesearchaeota archaeon]
MEVNVLEKEKNKLKIEFSENNQAILNLIKSELWKNSSTEAAGFRIEHPETSKPIFILRTKRKSAKSVWNDTIKDLTKQIKAIK